MALATTCPSCKTSFKVNPEQLKLRKGLVRCGKCQHVFSGIQYLRYISESRKPRPVRKRKPVEEVAPETVAEDLNTAFFLPDTRFEPEPDDTRPDAGPADRPYRTPRQKPSLADGTVKASAASPANAPDTPVDPDTIAPDTVSPDTVSTDTVSASGDDNNSPSRRSRKSRRNRRKNRRRSKQTETTAQREEAAQATAVTAATATAVVGAAGAALASRATTNAPDEATDTVESSDSDQPRDTDAPGSTTPGHLPDHERKTADAIADPVQGDMDIPRHRASADQSADTADPVTAKSKSRHGAQPDQAETTPVAKDAGTTTKQDEHWLDGISEESGDDEQAILDDEEEDAIDFFGQTSRPVFDFDLPPRSVWIAAGALALLLTIQMAIGARDSLAALFPSAKPVLESVSNRLGLQIQLPMKPDAIRIESHDLANAPTSAGPGSYVLNLLIRNHADITLRWPAIELTLTDRTGANILVRKALLPGDYLADDQRAARGMPALSEQAVRLNLRTENIGPMHGYTAVLFYP